MSRDLTVEAALVFAGDKIIIGGRPFRVTHVERRGKKKVAFTCGEYVFVYDKETDVEIQR